MTSYELNESNEWGTVCHDGREGEKPRHTDRHAAVHSWQEPRRSEPSFTMMGPLCEARRVGAESRQDFTLRDQLPCRSGGSSARTVGDERRCPNFRKPSPISRACGRASAPRAASRTHTTVVPPIRALRRRMKLKHSSLSVLSRATVILDREKRRAPIFRVD
jgi:hypothetical protein